MSKIFAASKALTQDQPEPLEFFLPGSEDTGHLNPEWVEWDKTPPGEDGKTGAEPEPKYIVGPLHVYPPTTSQIAIIVASGSDLVEEDEQAASFINVFYEMLAEDSRRVFKRLLLDRNSGVDLDTVMNILTWAMERTTDFPTEPSSASSPSRKNAGRASTAGARRKASNRSR